MVKDDTVQIRSADNTNEYPHTDSLHTLIDTKAHKDTC